MDAITGAIQSRKRGSMTREEAEKIIKERFIPVEDKPGYVWFSKRNFQIISIETLTKSLEDWCPKGVNE